MAVFNLRVSFRSSLRKKMGYLHRLNREYKTRCKSEIAEEIIMIKSSL